MSSLQDTHLLLIRHAESLSNRYELDAGPDSGLTAQGWEQAHRLGEWLAKNESVNVIVSSPMVRARQTADVLSFHLGLPVHIQPGLEETDKPYWEEFPPFTESRGLPDEPWNPTPETAPTYMAFRARVVSALRLVLNQFWGQHIAMVTHGGTMSTLLRTLVGGHHVSVYQDNTAIHKFTWGHERWTLIYANRVEHLHGMEQPAANAASRPVAGSASLIRLNFHALSQAQIERILRISRPQPDEQALDITTGDGALAVALAPLVDQVTAVDVKPHLLEQAELARLSAGYNNVYVHWADPGRLTFPDNSFDLVTCAYGLHRLPDAAVAVREMARVCRPGKRVLIHDLVGDDDPVKRATQNVIELRRDSSHVTLLTADHIRNLVTAVGLEIDQCDLSETEQRLDDWLNMANADEDTIEAVSTMLDAAIEGDAAGMQVHRERDGSLSFRQRLITLLAYKPEH